MKRYLTSIGQIVDTIGDMPVDLINAATITDYASRRSLVATNATIRRDITALSRLLAARVAWGRRQDRSLLRERAYIGASDENVEKLIAASPPGVAAILRLLAETGMRENEAVTLEAADIDASRGQIRLIRTKTSRPRTLDLANTWRRCRSGSQGMPRARPCVPECLWFGVSKLCLECQSGLPPVAGRRSVIQAIPCP